MKRNPFGTFEISIPPNEKGEAAIKHDSKIKVRRETQVDEECGRKLTFALSIARSFTSNYRPERRSIESLLGCELDFLDLNLPAPR